MTSEAGVARAVAGDAPPQHDARAPLPGKERWAAYALTWLSYATYYTGRKNFSVARSAIVERLGAGALVFYRPSRYVAVGVETAYLAAYAVGQYVNGRLGDRVGARRLVGVGMLVSAAACVAFGASSAALGFVAAYAVNGFAQATGWPGNVKAMAEWTTPENRGAVMGAWTTCYQVGGVAATALAAALIRRAGWRSTFFAPALVLAAVGVMVLLWLRPGPGSSLPGPPAGRGREENAAARGREENAAARREAQRAVLRSPLIWSYGASYFFIKLIRYSLLFWLPFYLHKVLLYSEDDAGYLSTAFEIGGVAGTIGLGRLSDKLRRLSRAHWSALSLLGLAAALFAYGRLGGIGVTTNFALMALVGALLFGPDALLSGAATQDAGGPRAAAIAAGLVNAIGSAGAILQELVTRGVSDNYGWDALFRVFLVFAVLAALALTPAMLTKPTAEASS